MSLADAKQLNLGGKSVIRLDIGGGTVWKGLPEGYTPVNYIETTGTQYIDTEFMPNQNSRLLCEALYYGGVGVCGARNAVSNNNHSVRVIYEEWQFGYGDGVRSSGIAADYTEYHTFDLNRNKFYLDGVLGVEFAYEEFQCSYSYALGGIRAGSMYYGKGRYRSAKVYDNGVLIRDLIPCKNPVGEAGMYDTLNAKFYGNAGTGEFLVG